MLFSGKEYLREKGYQVVIGSGWDIETIKKEVVDADALIVRTASYPAEVIREGKNLKVISRHGIGYDNIDIKAAEEQGIYVTVTKNENTSYAVAEHAMAMIMALSKKFPVFCPAIRKDNWQVRTRLLTNQLNGKTLGLIGCGAIGQKLAKMMYFGMEVNVIGYDAYMKPEQFPEYIAYKDNMEDVLKEADYISLHVPLTEETRGMIGEREFDLMKSTAILVNCARGGVVDEQALFQALVSGQIMAAGLDCFEKEPQKSDNPLVKLSNFICTPHNAGMSQEAQDLSGLISAQAVDDVLNGRTPKFPVNHPVLK